MTVAGAMIDQVLAAEARLTQAVLSGARSLAEDVLAPDFVAIGHAGNLVDRHDYLDIHFAPERRFTQFETEGHEHFTAGEAVVVTGRVTMVNANLAHNPPPARYVAIYVLDAGETWRIRFWQETPIDPTARF